MRYRLTWEFALKDERDYQLVKSLIKQALAEVASHHRHKGWINPDYLALEEINDYR